METEKPKKVYRVKMDKSPEAHLYPVGKVGKPKIGNNNGVSIIDGCLASFGEIMNYNKKEAKKKAEMFQGVVEPIFLKPVKTTFKLWTVIEKRIEYEDGSEEFSDIEDSCVSSGEFFDMEDAMQRGEEIHIQFGKTGSAN